MTRLTPTVFVFLPVIALFSCASNRSGSGATASDVVNNNHDAGASDAATSANSAFPQWWDPACKNADGTCNTTTCRPSELTEFRAPCGVATTLGGGCLSKDTATPGWGCWLRTSDNEIIESLDVPLDFTGLQSCQAAGLQQSPAYLDPNCPDSGSH